MQTEDGTVTAALVQGARDGDREAVDRLFELAYGELRRRAHWARRGGSATLNTTALVHEAYLKLTPDRGLPISDRAHFNYIMVRAMRQVLVDAARRRGAEKRGGDRDFVTLHEGDGSAAVRPDQLLALDEALERLAAFDERKAKVVECRFFCGFEVEETADILDVSPATVKRDWRSARAWLAHELDETA
ncbi:MAG: ECF-type sigma factor [Gemmatimonadota bacterium]